MVGGLGAAGGVAGLLAAAPPPGASGPELLRFFLRSFLSIPSFLLPSPKLIDSSSSPTPLPSRIAYHLAQPYPRLAPPFSIRHARCIERSSRATVGGCRAVASCSSPRCCSDDGRVPCTRRRPAHGGIFQLWECSVTIVAGGTISTDAVTAARDVSRRGVARVEPGRFIWRRFCHNSEDVYSAADGFVDGVVRTCATRCTTR